MTPDAAALRLAGLAAVYLLVGAGAAAALWTRAPAARGRVADAALLVPLWPLYLPFVLLREPAVPARRLGFLAALARARGTPLADLLPDEATARALAERLDRAATRVAELDRLLAQPDLDEDAARARRDALAARAADGPGSAGAGPAADALAAVESRLANIRRLRALRARFARELEAVHEIAAQLRIQAEVVRLVGEADDGTRDLLVELLARVEGLDAILADG